MKASKKFICVGALVAGGVLSLTYSLLGMFGLLWGGFPTSADNSKAFGFFLPFLLSFPLFILSLGITRFAVFGLWVAVLYHWISLVLISVRDAHSEPSGMLAVLAIDFFQRTILMLLLPACLILFGVQVFRDFSFDRFMMRKFGAGRAAES